MWNELSTYTGYVYYTYIKQYYAVSIETSDNVQAHVLACVCVCVCRSVVCIFGGRWTVARRRVRYGRSSRVSVHPQFAVDWPGGERNLDDINLLTAESHAVIDGPASDCRRECFQSICACMIHCADSRNGNNVRRWTVTVFNRLTWLFATM